MKPTAQLCGRLRFTTKEVGRGFYRGNRTGSKGAHTGFGGYVIDWRKTSHYNVPDMEGFSLTPFVTLEMEPTSRVREHPDGTLHTPDKVDAMQFLRDWKRLNTEEYDRYWDWQEAEENKRIQEEEALRTPANAQVDFYPEEKQPESKTP
ncbi:hypothetical protein EDD37DRAFT_320395 [Exophiala viscosa]|uniref:Uncharacterized protein n=1 Tax=Exophiala viscosa TaxID=2486360 RepID=A0AAN6DU21_9EURO|nr:hypothetical protein EDD36DRAFT_464962 [Exophiala viscosa]KAI1625881.1 hypothetical protein EDD37DRAFT_320395 [Exophiala viscosa]